MSPNEILEKIRKLLAVATNDAATPGEVEAALNRIAHLQQTYGISDEEISKIVTKDKDNNVHIDPKNVVNETLYTSGRLTRWPTWTGQAVSLASSCKMYTSHTNLKIVGLPIDVAVARELFRFCMDKGDAMQKTWADLNGQQRGGKPAKAWRDGYCQGLIEAGRKAYQESFTRNEKVNPESSSTALVVYSVGQMAIMKRDAIMAVTKTIGLRSGDPNRHRAYTGQSSYNQGYNVGQNTNLNRKTIQ
jgi:hypothetical protein